MRGGWSRSLAHVHLHLRHLQSSVPAGMSEGGRGRVDRSTHGAHSQGRPGRRCVTLREALHQGHVTVSQCHQTCHPPQCHQTWPHPCPSHGVLLLCALPLPSRPPSHARMLCDVYFYRSRDAGGQDQDPRGSASSCGWQQHDTTFTSPNLPLTAFWVCLLVPFSLSAHVCTHSSARARQRKALHSPCSL